jgi:hypothetical protein
MFANTIDPNDPAFREVSRHLEAYADLRLSPSMAATTQMRMRVMDAAHRRAALIQADATFGAADPTVSALEARRTRVAHHQWRRPMAAAIAACLTLGSLVGAAYAAQPGGALYAARMWTEMANLPAGPVDRANAEVARLGQRLAEAQQASTAGDTIATEAALAAYTQILAEAEAAASSTGDPTATAALELSVTHHVAVLTLLSGTVPAPARAAVEHALSSSAMVLQDLGAPGAKGNQGGEGGGIVGGDPGKSTEPPRGGKGATATPTPTATPHPAATPRSEPNPKPAPTPRPTRTTKPAEIHKGPNAQATPTPRAAP